jgi:hypothetical protein
MLSGSFSRLPLLHLRRRVRLTRVAAPMASWRLQHRNDTGPGTGPLTAAHLKISRSFDARNLFHCDGDPSNRATGQQINFPWKRCGSVLNGNGMGRAIPDTAPRHRIFCRQPCTGNPQTGNNPASTSSKPGKLFSAIELHPPTARIIRGTQLRCVALMKSNMERLIGM